MKDPEELANEPPLSEAARAGYFACFVCQSAIAVIVQMNRSQPAVSNFHWPKTN